MNKRVRRRRAYSYSMLAETEPPNFSNGLVELQHEVSNATAQNVLKEKKLANIWGLYPGREISPGLAKIKRTQHVELDSSSQLSDFPISRRKRLRRPMGFSARLKGEVLKELDRMGEGGLAQETSTVPSLIPSKLLCLIVNDVIIEQYTDKTDVLTRIS
ncbi:hypothetical protein M569_00390 [Genlisea aurea]|uniref:Uncharacterized protein n=1 Tax=Genlisea aurea TaxID=192259 RepID=S8EEJ2_9LAMI|nr:hypothetical protein M569_00390 [Genlisea aurea]